MFNRNKAKPTPKRKHDLSQYGLFEIPSDIGINNENDDDDENESDLEAELANLTSGDAPKLRPKPKPKSQVTQSDLDKMVAESLKDIGSDDELSDGDNDPDLLNELATMSDIEPENIIESTLPVSPEVPSPEPTKSDQILVATTALNTADIIKSRIKMYKEAESNARSANEGARAKRIGRGLKTLESLQKEVLAGKNIDVNEIPPEVLVKPVQIHREPVAVTEPTPAVAPVEVILPIALPSSPPSADALYVTSEPSNTTQLVTPASVTSSSDEKITALLTRQKEYKEAALLAKRNDEKAVALQYIKIVKVFDQVLTAARAGEAVDLSDMPPPPSQLSLTDLAIPSVSIANSPTSATKENQEIQGSAEVSAAPEQGVITASSILEALIQRLDMYKSLLQKAKDEENSSKARRQDRIVKQFEIAIKQHKAGKAVDFEELPTPPGYGPIPISGTPQPKPSSATTPIVKPTASDEKTSPSRRPLVKQDSRVSGNHSSTSLMHRTIETLLERQKEFKDAALTAKKSGEIEQAKQYLKIFKQFDGLLNAARGGLPVDLTTLPISPSQRDSLENSFNTVNDDEGNHTSDDHDVLSRLEEQLQNQLAMCKTTRDHHKALGDVSGTNRFENLALSVQKDLDIIKFVRRKKTPIPKFHYEQKSFNILKCNTDLAETQLEINVLKGIGYHVSNPKDVDTYVKIEFPFPQETPFRAKTAVINDQDSPEYNEKFIAEIQPKARLCQRVFKRHAIKFEVYSKSGFLGIFRSDTLIGTATVKLQPLETAVEIHDSFELMDGRKSVGGKLEIQVRIRNPIVAKQIEHITEKWLILDT